MDAIPRQPRRLAYDSAGTGTPIVFLHGLTFNRGNWGPIVERLAGRFRCITVDLPGHGQSAGPPRPMEEIAGELHTLIRELSIDNPVVVGHSIAASIASMYGAMYPAAGVVNVDQPLDVRPFAYFIRELEPALRGPNFEAAFEPFRRSMGVDLLPEPTRSSVTASQRIDQDLVLGYWDEAFRTAPQALQSKIDAMCGSILIPYLAIYNHVLSEEERAHMYRLIPNAEVEEWPGGGHLVHLADPERFSDRLAVFVEATRPIS